jgi:phosphoribosylaminoimidazolecarboxamide formyltransferase/IMP cyclohydrolase
VQALKFKPGTKRAEVANAIDNFVGGTADKGWVSSVEGGAPSELSMQERQEWAAKLSGVALSSDAFFPFADNIQRAKLVIFYSTSSSVFQEFYNITYSRYIQKN